MDIHKRLQEVLQERGWTRYRLAKEANLPEPTITNIFKRNSMPTIGTLEIICKGLDITLSQFFAENDMIELTPSMKECFEEWKNLTADQKNAILYTMRSMHK